MPDALPKHLDHRDQWEVADFIRYAETGEMPINPDWAERRNRALAGAGLEVDDVDGATKALEDMTPEDHAQRRFGQG